MIYEKTLGLTKFEVTFWEVFKSVYLLKVQWNVIMTNIGRAYNHRNVLRAGFLLNQNAKYALATFPRNDYT